MESLKTKPEICAKCDGKDFVLLNTSGRLDAKLCECFNCEKCDGEGRIFTQKEDGRSFLTDCSCRVFQNRLRLLNGAGISGKFSRADFESYETSKPFHDSQKKAKSRALDFILDFRKAGGALNRGLVFMGGPGLGKTHLAVALIKSLILEDGIDCKFVDFFQLLSDIRHGYSQDLSEQTLIKPYVNSRVLVIDELAKGRNNEWELTVLDQFISSRYNADDKITLFTSNYPKDQDRRKKDNGNNFSFPESGSNDSFTRETLQERIGERIFSRLVEMCDFVIMQGKDFRILKKPMS